MPITGTQPLDFGSVPTSDTYSPQNNTFPLMPGADGAFVDQFGNQSSPPIMSFIQPRIVQRASATTSATGGSTSLICPFQNVNVGGNSLVVCVGVGAVESAGMSLVVTDLQGNVYTRVASSPLQGGLLESAIFFVPGIKLGANTIKVSLVGPLARPTGIAMRIYEVSGLINALSSFDQVAVGSNASSNAASTGIVSPVVPNEMAFSALATSGIVSLTPATGWTSDLTTLFPWGGNCQSFDSQSRLISTLTPITPQASLSLPSAWTMAVASFRSIIVPIEGTVIAQQGGLWVVNIGGPLPAGSNVLGGVTQSGPWGQSPVAATSGGSIPYHLMSVASTNATVAKSSPGQIYGYDLSNNNAAVRYVKFYDLTRAPNVGTDIPKRVVQVPANGMAIRAFPEGLQFLTGIAFATTGGIADTDTSSVGLNDLSVDFNYK